MAVARSMQVPVHVYARMLTRDVFREAVLDRILRQTRRIRSLHLGLPHRLLRRVVEVFTEPAPLLEDLTLEDCTPVSSNYYIPSSAMVSLIAFSPEAFPSLRRLEVCRAVLPWDSHIYCATIVDLIVTTRAAWVPFLGSLQNFMSALG